MSGTVTPTGQPLDPPHDAQPLDASTGLHTPIWAQYQQMLADRIAAGVIMQTGTSTSDSAGLISVTLPAPYTIRTLDFQCDGSPGEANAYFNQGTVVALPLDVITGTLEVLDTGTGSVVAVANTDFTWFATGV